MFKNTRDIKVSIIMPVYGVSGYIERCLQSVMNQTYGNIECIIVDDATPDDSIIKCERMIAEYSGSISFSILNHNQNRGLSAARNTGTAAASGEYVFYLDSDDVITDDCIELLMAPAMRDSSINIVMGRGERVSAGNPLSTGLVRERQSQEFRSSEAVRDFFFGGERTVFAAWNKVINRNFISRSGLSFKEGILWEDTLWTFFLMKYLVHLYIINDVTYYYCRRPQSITLGTDVQTKRHYWGVVFNEISNNFTPGEGNREARHYVRRFCRQYSHCPNDELYRMTARNFRKELSVIYNPAECTLLFLINFMSKSGVGRIGLQLLLKTYHAIRSVIC